MERLKYVGFKDIIHSDYGDSWYEDDQIHRHVFKLTGSTREFCRIQCGKCGFIKEVINPEYIRAWARAQNEAANDLMNKKKDPRSMGPRFDSIDREHARRGFDKYDGDLKKDLLQPYNPDGTVNPDFVKVYGKPRYRKIG